MITHTHIHTHTHTYTHTHTHSCTQVGGSSAYGAKGKYGCIDVHVATKHLGGVYTRTLLRKTNPKLPFILEKVTV